MKHATAFIILLLATLPAGGLFFACGDDDDDSRHVPAGDDDDGDDAQPPVDDDDDDDDDDDVDPGNWTPEDFSGVWNGSMDIVMESGQGGGTASIRMEIEVAEDWSFTGTFSDPTCPDDPACPDHEALSGSIDLMFDTVAFSFRFDCGADGITYFYFMEGDVAWQHMSGEFFSLDGVNVQQNHGAWEVSK